MSEPHTEESVLDQIIKGSGLMARPTILDGYEGYAVIPKELKLESMEPLLLNPRRVRWTETLADAASFIAYVQRFKMPGTIVKAARLMPSGLGTIMAVIDYHEPATPHWCQNVATLPLALHRRFQAWVDSNNKMMTQVQFAEWLDERIHEIVTPPGADMIEMIQWLEATSHASFKSVLNLTNGRTTFSFDDPMALKAKGTDAELPRVISLLLPVVEGGNDVEVDVNLRYRLESDRLKLFYRIPNLADLLEKSWTEVTATVEKTLSLPFYRVK